MADIKGFIYTLDSSLILFIITILVGLYIGYFIFKKVYIYTKNNCKVNCDKYFFYKFSNIDWSNPKRAVYEATFYGRLLASNDRRKKIFLQLKKELDRYKYTKTIDRIDKELINLYNLYKQVCDE